MMRLRLNAADTVNRGFVVGWLVGLQRHNKFLACLKIDTLKLGTTLGKTPRWIGRQFLTAGHLNVGTCLNVNGLMFQITSQGCTNAFGFVFLVG